LGAVNLVIGKGTATTGTFGSIDWGTGTYFLGIELNTGNGFIAMGTTQLLSVPYALYANSSGNNQTPTPNLASVLAVNNSANNTKITNLADPINPQDAVTKSYLETQIAALQAQISAISNTGSSQPDGLTAYLFMESSDDATASGNVNNDILLYMLANAKNNWYGFWTSGIVDINATDLAIYMDWPGFKNGTANVPTPIKITIPQTTGGIDQYGNPIVAFTFLTTKVIANSTRGNIWYSVFVPSAKTNNKMYSTIGFNYNSSNNLTYASTEPNLYLLNINYTGGNYGNSIYKVYSGSVQGSGFNSGYQGVINSEDHYFRGGSFTQ
jgi:hypothetical protein